MVNACQENTIRYSMKQKMTVIHRQKPKINGKAVKRD